MTRSIGLRRVATVRCCGLEHDSGVSGSGAHMGVNAVHARVVAAPDQVRDKLRDLTRCCSALTPFCGVRPVDSGDPGNGDRVAVPRSGENADLICCGLRLVWHPPKSSRRFRSVFSRYSRGYSLGASPARQYALLPGHLSCGCHDLSIPFSLAT